MVEWSKKPVILAILGWRFLMGALYQILRVHGQLIFCFEMSCWDWGGSLGRWMLSIPTWDAVESSSLDRRKTLSQIKYPSVTVMVLVVFSMCNRWPWKCLIACIWQQLPLYVHPALYLWHIMLCIKWRCLLFCVSVRMPSLLLTIVSPLFLCTALEKLAVAFATRGCCPCPAMFVARHPNAHWLCSAPKYSATPSNTPG